MMLPVFTSCNWFEKEEEVELNIIDDNYRNWYEIYVGSFWDTNNDGIGAQLILKTRVAVPVYVDKGNFTKKAEVESFEIVKMPDGLYTKAKILSTGNSRY